jgi:hypothetical protein
LGGVAAKAGLFKAIFVFPLAAKKFVVIAIAAVLAFVRKLFGGKKKSAVLSPCIAPHSSESL